MARIMINTLTYSERFVILELCMRNEILGMDVLNQQGAVIDFRSELIMLATDNAVPPDWKNGLPALNVTEEQITVPPNSSVVINVGTEQPTDLEGDIEGNPHLLLNRQICVARGIAELRHRKERVMQTNFSHEWKHLNIGTTVAYVDEFVDASNIIALFDATEPASTNRSRQPAFEVNPSLPKHKQDRLKTLLLQFKDCFSSSSRIRRTLVA